jgi:hypothetical protein
MEDNTPTEEAPQQETEQSDQQTDPNKPKLMPGQEHEDELDYLGAGLVALVTRGFESLRNFFAPKKVE